MTTTITGVIARDIRFPTSRTLDGSDAMTPNPDYSAAYVTLHTDSTGGLAGHRARPAIASPMRPESLDAYEFPTGTAWAAHVPALAHVYRHGTTPQS